MIPRLTTLAAFLVLASSALAGDIDMQAARRHWAFQPLRTGPLPAVKDNAWPQTPMDRFILAKLEERGLSPAPKAPPQVLIRRLYFDLIGLPPTAEEIEAFVADYQSAVHNPQSAIEKLVDRLLASPHYGERWGRHWLDVARYADTKDGVLMYGDDRVRPYAYTYRDYVIRALNDDLPINRFVHEQLAADQIQPKVAPRQMAALGFLTLGRMFDNNIYDIIDDRIDTVTRGLLGLTVSCARCHDHKYDPIPTADYYSFYGVFSNCEVPIELPLLEPVVAGSPSAEFEKQAAAKREEIRKFLDSQYTLLLETARQRVVDYLVHAATTEPDPLETAIFFLSLAPTDLRPQIVARWRRLLAQRGTADDPVFAPWHAVMPAKDGEIARTFSEQKSKWEAKSAGIEAGQVNPLVRKALASAKPTTRVEFARVYGDLLKKVYDESKKSPPTSPGVSAGATPEALLEAKARQQLLDLVSGVDSPLYFAKNRTRDYMSRGEKDAFGGKLQELDRMAVKAANAPARAMAVVDTEQIHEPRIFQRGNPAAAGERVPRQFLTVLSNSDRKPFSHGSGRLDLAQAITDHPLFARVFVNRVWMHHFGEPLVENPSDFGVRTPKPAHADLLDFLAGALQQNGWSLKKLHRMIVLSAAYGQSSSISDFGFRISDSKISPQSAIRNPQLLDADNRLVWRANRRRLDLEAMRDSMLAVAGRLDRTMHDRPVDVASDPRNRRRTVYGLVDRQSLPALFRAFDFASPDHTVERRPMTTVPQQALFAMNSPFVLEQAKAVAAIAANEKDETAKITALYRRILGRSPTDAERRLAGAFARTTNSQSSLNGWAQLAQVLLLTNEAQFVE